MFDVVLCYVHKTKFNSFSRLNKLVYSCNIAEGLFKLMFECGFVENDILNGDLCRLNFECISFKLNLMKVI